MNDDDQTSESRRKASPNWTTDLAGNPIPLEVSRIIRYFLRAWGVLEHALSPEVSPEARAMSTAFCVHACHSLRESFGHYVGDPARDSDEIKGKVRELPYAKLIQQVRDHDIHGHPLPVCDPECNLGLWTSRTGKPIRLGSSGGVVNQIQMEGAKPVNKRYPKNVSKAPYSPGDSVSCRCAEGELIVYDFSTQKEVRLLQAVREFLIQSYEIVLMIAKNHDLIISTTDEGAKD